VLLARPAPASNTSLVRCLSSGFSTDGAIGLELEKVIRVCIRSFDIKRFDYIYIKQKILYPILDGDSIPVIKN